jgi:hypothetical protein
MSRCIGCDVLEKDEDVVGRTRDQRRVCGGAGQREGVSLWHASVRISYNRALHCVSKCTTTLSEAGRGCGFDAGVLVDTSYTPGPTNRAPILERLAKAAYSHTATQPRSHRYRVSSDRLQLSYFKRGVRGLFI